MVFVLAKLLLFLNNVIKETFFCKKRPKLLSCPAKVVPLYGENQNYPKQMKIVCAFDSFKGCMTAREACRAAASGLSERFPHAAVVCLPMSDGGEGMMDCIAEALGATMVSVPVHDALMQIIQARYAISADGTTAYMEMAAASGLTLVPKDRRNPMLTTTFGVGEMLLDAVGRGCTKIVMGIGGSATCDGGRGMVECLDGRLPLPVEITVASDVSNPLYGEHGAACVFAPQKGATPGQVRLLDEQLRAFARQTEARGIALPDLAWHPGAGAAGGLGYGLMAYLGATLQSGIDLLLDAIHFNEQTEGADFILTGEGKSDRQTLMGKVPEGVLKRVRARGIPVHLLSGAIEDAPALKEAGFASVASINQDDQRPLDILMQRDVAMENLRNTITHFHLFDTE